MNRRFLRLPVDADEGFPQAFRLNFAGAEYVVSLHVNVPESIQPVPLDRVHDLSLGDGVMVMRVDRDDSSATRTVLLRKLVVGKLYEADRFALVFSEIKVARRNLNGVGAFGSRVTGGIAERWPS